MRKQTGCAVARSIAPKSKRISPSAASCWSSGAGAIVTGNSLGVGNVAGDGSLASRYRRRQLKTWFAFTSYRRATIETDAPGSDVAATISRFNASGQRLCRLFASLVSMSAFVDTFPPALTIKARGRLDHVRSRHRAVPTGGDGPSASLGDLPRQA